MMTKKTDSQGESFQDRVGLFMQECFGIEISLDRKERNHRFLEESLELVQADNCTESEAHQLVDYVYSRPVGEKTQETGGVMLTLAALCRAHGINMQECGEIELRRVWTKIDLIREKQAAKPKHSPLPIVQDKPQSFDFTGWLNELDKIARIGGFKGSMVESTGKESWTGYFEGGYSPADAYLEDMSYAD